MAPRDVDIEELTSLLGQCLGRIDEQAYRLQNRDEGEAEDDQAADVLEEEASRLQNLVASLVEAVDTERLDTADLNRTVSRTVRDTLQELAQPVVIRQRLAENLPAVACKPGQLSYAVQRAVLLAIAYAGSGGEVELDTRVDDDGVLFELIARSGGHGDQRIDERATTLAEFVEGFAGRCRLDTDEQHELLLVLELPAVYATD